jgi:hypothetical protein
MIIAIQIAVNPSQPEWENELQKACNALWIETGTSSTAIVAYSKEAAAKLVNVAIEMDVPIITLPH